MKDEERKAFIGQIHRGIKKRIKNHQRAIRHNVRQQLKTISREESK